MPPPLVGGDKGEALAHDGHRQYNLSIGVFAPREGNKSIHLDFGRWGLPPTESPTLVLLHEGLGSATQWRDFPNRLARTTGQGVLAYSRLGYGHSDPAPLPWPVDYMHREAHEILPAVLDAAGIRSCIVIGHSDGASIAAIYASRHDPRLRGVVLIAPHFVVEDAAIAAIRDITAKYPDGKLRARLARHHADPDMPFHGWSGAWLDPNFRKTFNLAGELTEIRVPILILQGTNDPYGTAAQPRMAERLAPGRVQTVLLDAAHAPHLEAADATLLAITDFVAHHLHPDVSDH